MLYWALLFFLADLVAAAFGFGGIAAGAASVAKVIFFIFFLLLAITLIMHVARGNKPPL